MDYCLQSGAKTESKVKSLTAGMLDFSGLGFLTAILLSSSKTLTTISCFSLSYLLLGGLHLTTTLTVYVLEGALSLGGIVKENCFKINFKNDKFNSKLGYQFIFIKK